MTTLQQSASDRKSTGPARGPNSLALANLLERLWRAGRRPHEILRAALIECGLDRSFDDLNRDIRAARLSSITVTSGWVARRSQRSANEWQAQKDRLLAEFEEAIGALIDGGLYVVVMKEASLFVLLGPTARATAKVDYEQSSLRLGDKVYSDVRLAPAWCVKPGEVKVLEGVVTTQSIRDARTRLWRTGAPRAAPSTVSVGLLPAAMKAQARAQMADDRMVPPSRQTKRLPPDYSAIVGPAKPQRRGPRPTWREHLALMEARARRGPLEETPTKEFKRLIELAVANNFPHRPSLKTLRNNLSKRYRELMPGKRS